MSATLLYSMTKQQTVLHRQAGSFTPKQRHTHFSTTHLLVPTHSTVVQGRLAVSICCIQVGTSLNKQLHDCSLAPVGGKMQGAATALIPAV